MHILLQLVLSDGHVSMQAEMVAQASGASLVI